MYTSADMTGARFCLAFFSYVSANHFYESTQNELSATMDAISLNCVRPVISLKLKIMLPKCRKMRYKDGKLNNEGASMQRKDGEKVLRVRRI